VIATCRQPESCAGLQALQAQYPDRLFVMRLDVTDGASIEEAADLVRARCAAGIHLLINASGVLHVPGEMHPEANLGQVTPHALAAAFSVNAQGPLLVLQAFAPLLARGVEVNACAGVPSVCASLSARVSSLRENRLGGWYAYRASKAALNMLMRTAAVELAKDQPRMMCVLLHPGTVDTALSRPFNRNGARVHASQLHRVLLLRTRCGAPPTVPAKMLFTPQASVTCLMDVIGRLKAEDNGKLLGWDGSQIDW
jgi:NAD(P)-dependent dehydrogenase (short-subunit alcohol dehydrogenase family)